jgi:hypothetical protein
LNVAEYSILGRASAQVKPATQFSHDAMFRRAQDAGGFILFQNGFTPVGEARIA